MANTPQRFFKTFTIVITIYSVPLLDAISEKLMESELSKEVYKLSKTNWGKMTHFGRVGVFPKK